ncbi:MAG: hypothetical protein ACOCRX_07205 [Candidatus Woesearchaeota archaeon]
MKKEELTKEQVKSLVDQYGPKWCFKQNILNEGYRIGFTKPTLESRKIYRRKKNKLARMARKKNR